MEENFFENELAQRFEEMINNDEEYYFDTSDLEDIIIYYLEIGDISFAEMAVKYALKLHPNSQEIKVKSLEVLLELQKYAEAKQIIAELKENSVEDLDYLVCCAKYYSNLGNPKRSIEFCQKALQYGEERNFLNNFIADEYANLDEPYLALLYYKKALDADPYDDYALECVMGCYTRLNRMQEALEFINSYLDKFPFSEVAWFEYSLLFFNRKNYEEAINGLDYLLSINPQVVRAYTYKSECYELLKDWDNAIKTYEEIIDLEYTKAYTHYRIGLCYKQKSEMMLSIQAFQKSLIEDPQFYLSMMELSYSYENLGDKAEALRYAEEATSLNTNNLDYLKRLAYLYIDLGKISKSVECLKKITQTEPEKFYNWYAYTEALMLLEAYEEAVNVLKSALVIHKRAELYYQLSNAYFHLDEMEKSKEALNLALHKNINLLADMQQKYPFMREVIKYDS